MSEPVLRVDDRGLYCPAGNFHIDPWHPVERAVITHAHGDHARPGSTSYLCAEPGRLPLVLRVGERVQTLAYGQQLKINDALVSLHPAGHVLGSAQIRVEVGGDVWVASGDYKRQQDPTCDPFEIVQCRVFITESTFGLPVYRWDPPADVIQEIVDWWKKNAEADRPSILLSYVMGKTQRIMTSLAALTDSNVGLFAHGALQQMNEAYRASSVYLPKAPNPLDMGNGYDFSKALIIAPPSVAGTPWMLRFKHGVSGRASGWMRIRGRRRRLALDRGFVLSDHADWPALLRTIFETNAERVLVTHGSSEVLARYLSERGLAAEPLGVDRWGEQEEQE